MTEERYDTYDAYRAGRIAACLYVAERALADASADALGLEIHDEDIPTWRAITKLYEGIRDYRAGFTDGGIGGKAMSGQRKR